MVDAVGSRGRTEAARPTVLLADNDVALVAGMAEILNSYGFACDVADSWMELLVRLQSADYDLVILEVWLGRVDLIDRFAELASCTTAPIVFLTQNSSEVDRILALEKGAAGVLRKPVSGREVVAQIRAHLRRSAASNRPPEPQPTWRIGCGQLALTAPFPALASSNSNPLRYATLEAAKRGARAGLAASAAYVRPFEEARRFLTTRIGEWAEARAH